MFGARLRQAHSKNYQTAEAFPAVDTTVETNTLRQVIYKRIAAVPLHGAHTTHNPIPAAPLSSPRSGLSALRAAAECAEGFGLGGHSEIPGKHARGSRRRVRAHAPTVPAAAHAPGHGARTRIRAWVRAWVWAWVFTGAGQRTPWVWTGASAHLRTGPGAGIWRWCRWRRRRRRWRWRSG
jgi:hypothetical protein